MIPRPHSCRPPPMYACRLNRHGWTSSATSADAGSQSSKMMGLLEWKVGRPKKLPQVRCFIRQYRSDKTYSVSPVQSWSSRMKRSCSCLRRRLRHPEVASSWFGMALLHGRTNLTPSACIPCAVSRVPSQDATRLGLLPPQFAR